MPAGAFSEALGCLAALDIPGHNYALMLRATRLPAFLAQLARQLQAGVPVLSASAGTDSSGSGGGDSCSQSAVGYAEQLQGEEGEAVLLEVVQVVGVLCADAECAEALAGAGLVSCVHGGQAEAYAAW